MHSVAFIKERAAQVGSAQPVLLLRGTPVERGTAQTVDLPIGLFSDHTPGTMSVRVVHGQRVGPTVFLSAAVHGDEVIGVEIVRRVLAAVDPARLRGTLLAVPIVNTFGFLARSRYLPDRRDLNRSFPGAADGSLASRMANLFVDEIVSRSSLGIDLHSAAIHRTNLPQVRITDGRGGLRELAETFGAPVIVRSPVRPGSLREVAARHQVPVLVYEAGEGLRFDETAVRAGVAGVMRVLGALGMLPKRGAGVPRPAKTRPVFVTNSRWVRAPESGLVRLLVDIGASVEVGERLAVVADPFGEREIAVTASVPGIVIGRATMPIVNAGDALFHVARVSDAERGAEAVEGMDALGDDPLFDEDEIV